MAATNVQGRRQYSTRSSRIVQNVLPTMLLLNKDIRSAGFFTFFSRVPTLKTPQEKFLWDVDEYMSITDTSSAAVTGTTNTVIPVTTPKRWNIGDLWMNTRTGEVQFVESLAIGTSQVTVIRAVTALSSGGGTAAAAINSGDTFLQIATAAGEDNRRRTTMTTTPTEVFGYSQFFRWELEMSRRQVKREFEQGSERTYLMEKRLNEARMELNRAFLFGEKGRFTHPTEGDVTLTSGIRPIPTPNVYAAGGTLYEADFNEWLVEEGMRDGSMNKTLFASTDVLLAIHQMAGDRLQYSPATMSIGGTKVGFKLTEYLAPNGGTLMLVEDRAITTAFNGEGYVVDMTELKRMIFSGNGYNDELHVVDDTGDKDDMGSTATLIGDMGLRWGFEQSHGKMSGVTGGAKGRSLS